MRVGDQLEVSLDGIAVTLATIETIEDGKATILIPATRVVMGIKSSLTPAVPEVERTTTSLVEDPTASAKSELETDWDSAFSGAPSLGQEKSLKEMDFDSSAID